MNRGAANQLTLGLTIGLGALLLACSRGSYVHQDGPGPARASGPPLPQDVEFSLTPEFDGPCEKKATIDVNLRAAPSQDAEVVTILGQGVELEVTGPPQDGWVPVTEPGTGESGYVSDQFLTVVV